MVNEEPKTLTFHDIMLDILNREKNAGGILDMRIDGGVLYCYFRNGERKVYYIKR